jgi:hypothetical protein
MTIQMQVTINEDIIKQAADRPKRGRPKRGTAPITPPKRCAFDLTDEAHAAIQSAAARLGVSGSALVEALGRTIMQSQMAA